MIFMSSKDKDKSEIRTDKYYITHKGLGLEKPAGIRSSNWVRRYVKTLWTLDHQRPSGDQIFDRVLYRDRVPQKAADYSRLVLVN